MQKTFSAALVFVLMCSVACWADGFEFDLAAGKTSVSGGVRYKKSLDSGYVKTGVDAVFTDDDDTEYQWINLNVMVGNENFAPGLTCEVGLNGIFGDAEEDNFSGDVGAVAFAGRIAYLFPQLLPLEIFAGLAHAPETLSFRDTKRYTSYSLGIGLQIVKNGTVFVEYTNYDIEMEDTAVDWDFDDDVVRFGVRMRF